jgi:hypothetical protein
LTELVPAAPAGRAQHDEHDPDLVVRDDERKPYTVRYEAVNAMLPDRWNAVQAIYKKEGPQSSSRHISGFPTARTEQSTATLLISFAMQSTNRAERHNQTMVLTASRRTIQLYMSSIRPSAATRVVARG